jgi:hypothetical protein
MEYIHPFVEKDHELVFHFFLNFLNVEEYSYVKSYSSTFLVFVYVFNFGLLTSRSIPLIIMFSHPFTSCFLEYSCTCDYKLSHSSPYYLKYLNYIQNVFLFFQCHLLD